MSWLASGNNIFGLRHYSYMTYYRKEIVNRIFIQVKYIHMHTCTSKIHIAALKL